MTNPVVAQAEAAKLAIRTEIESIMRKYMTQDSTIYQITFSQVPNAYSDEGYFAEGNVFIESTELDELDRDYDPYEGGYEAVSGVYSQDDDYGYFDKLEDDKWWCMARDIFNEINALSSVRDMMGDVRISVRK